MSGTGEFWDEVLTDHALWRMAQRNISLEDVLFVLDHGQKLYRAGALFFYLRKCDIPQKARRQFGRLEGTTVVLSREAPLVLTVYRNRQSGLRHVKRKLDRTSRTDATYMH